MVRFIKSVRVDEVTVYQSQLATLMFMSSANCSSDPDMWLAMANAESLPEGSISPYSKSLSVYHSPLRIPIKVLSYSSSSSNSTATHSSKPHVRSQLMP